MGTHRNVGLDRFPEQGEWRGNRAEVCFGYDADRTVLGTVVRDDREDPFVTLIRLDDGRVVRAEECQYSPFAPSSPDEGANGTRVSIDRLRELLAGCADEEDRQILRVALHSFETEATLRNLLRVIGSAGLNNLAKGVQLGSTSWFVKASDRVERAEHVLANSPNPRPAEAGDPS